MSTLAPPLHEAAREFECFGGTCTVLVQGNGPAGSPEIAADRAQRRLLDWHDQFSRFDAASELSQLNDDARACVPVSGMMARFVEAALHAAALTGGLVDPTLVSEVEAAGYTADLAPDAGAAAVVGTRPPAQPAAPSSAGRWRLIDVDRRRSTVNRSPGIRLDSGGIAKGLFGDVLASVLALHPSFAIEAAGDIRLGGTTRLVRPVQVASPRDPGHVLHTFEVVRGAVATSGISRRSWIDERGHLAHHLIDPATGRPAFTGVVQATALAPSGVEAEALAKAALLAGAGDALRWLPHGGLVVYDNGTHDVVEPRAGEVAR